MLKLTGYGLKEIIKKLERRRDTVKQQFEESLYFFQGETKLTEANDTANRLSHKYEELERNIALVQAVQAVYNTSLTITVQGEKYNLSHAIKLLGGAERIEKLWQKAAETGTPAYSSYDRVRVTGQEHAKRSILISTAIERAEKASTFVGALRAAIAVANSTEKEVSLSEDMIS